MQNPTPTFASKESNSDTKGYVPPIKDDSIDFRIDDTVIKSDTREKNKLFLVLKKSV